MRTTRYLLFCPDPKCAGADGVPVEWIDDTYNQAGEWSRDTCHCGHALQESMSIQHYQAFYGTGTVKEVSRES
jgi:hypothetical protein